MYGIELTPEHPIDRIVDLATRAERAGFDAAFVSSHYFNRDPFATLTRIATATDQLQLGPAAANPYETHPVALASRMATLQAVSDGRAVFGVGPGDGSALSALGIERDRPLRRVLEAFEVARDLWAGDRVTIDSTFEATDVGLEYSVDRSIPVYVAGQGPHMIRMSAKRADGLLLNASHPDDVEWAADRVAEGCADRPDDAGEFSFCVYASVSIAEDETAAREAARPPVAFIAADAAPPLLERHGIDESLAGEIGDALEEGAFDDAFAAVTPTMIDAFAVAGRPETVTDRLRTLRSIADGIVVGTPLGPDLEAAVDLAGEVLGRLDDQ
jgi:5,10-methylenetetrahydromethanopterin reductase